MGCLFASATQACFHPETRQVIETPQYFFLRVACALSDSVLDALTLYRLFSALEYLPSSPTLFNAGTRHEQLSSCFLLDSPQDSLESIYDKYKDVALLYFEEILERRFGG